MCSCVCVFVVKDSCYFGMNYSAGAAKTKPQMWIISGSAFNNFPIKAKTHHYIAIRTYFFFNKLTSVLGPHVGTSYIGSSYNGNTMRCVRAIVKFALAIVVCAESDKLVPPENNNIYELSSLDLWEQDRFLISVSHWKTERLCEVPQ